MRAVLWWGADDHSMSPKIPIHGGATALDSSYDDANCTSRSVCRRENGLPGTVTELSWDAAWWLNNLVADIVYTRFDRAAPVVRGAKQALDGQLEASLAAAEQAARAAFDAGDAANATAVLTAHAVAAGLQATQTWQQLWQSLMVSFIDGRVTTDDPDDHVCGCAKTSVDFSDEWGAKVVADTGDKYLVPESGAERARAAKPHPKRAPIPKLAIKGVRA